MKRLISLLAVALFGVALVGCSDNEETTPPTPPDPKPVDVYGWHMTKWEVGGDDTNFPKEVYIVFDLSLIHISEPTTIPYPVWTGFSASSIKKPGR